MNVSLYEKAKKIRFNAIHLSSLMKTGKFQREFRMRGLNFESIRDYVPGDDIRFIDWNATARFGKPYVKDFVEDSNIPIMLVLDLSASVTASHILWEKIQECALLLLYAAMWQHIPIGCTVFGYKQRGDAASHVIYIKPESTSMHYHRIENLLFSIDPDLSIQSNITDALFYINKKLHPGSLVFILSDFCIAGYKQYVMMLKTLHTVAGIRFIHNNSRLPCSALQGKDAESGNTYLLIPGLKYAKEAFREKKSFIESELYASFNALFLLELLEDDDVYMRLANFLKQRTLI
ncbi:MAG TPA: DUF58 domain-containing protein [Spirochaetales bacterium]|nr:DUF58 domain-containing protein [Spirochaetales bacterium]